MNKFTVCILYRGGFISKVHWPNIHEACGDMAFIGRTFILHPESMEEVLNVYIEEEKF